MKRLCFAILALSMASLSSAQKTPLLISPEGKGDSVKMEQLQEVTVKATRAGKRTPMAVLELKSEEIKASNHGKDVPSLFSMMPSVTTTSDAGAGIGYTSFRVRGTDPSRINITANGVPLNDGESSLVYFSNMGDFASSVKSIQMQRGVGTSTNGAGAFGATVNMLTEPVASKPFVSFDAAVGSYATHRETVRFGTGLIGEHFGIQGRLSNIGSNGYIDRATSSLNSYFLQAGWFGDNTVVKFITFNGKERTYMAWNYTSKYEQSLYGRTYNSCGLYYDKNGNMRFYEDQYDNYHQQHYQLHWNQHVGKQWTTNLALHYTRDGYDYDQMKTGKKLYQWLLTDDTAMRGDLVQRKGGTKDFYGVVASANYKNSKGLEVNMGGAVNRFYSKHDGNVIWVGTPYYKGAENVALPLPGLTPNNPYYNTTSHKTDANMYAKATWEVTRGLALFGDLQYRFINYELYGVLDDWDNNNKQLNIDIDKNFHFLNPKVGVNYEFLRHHRLYASYGIAHREPTRDHYQEHFGEDVRAERLGDVEVGYKFQHKRFSAGINLYHMHYKDQFVLTGELDDEGVAITKNIPKSYRMGMEIEAGWQPVEWFSWDANATLSRNRAKDMIVTLDDYTTKVNIGETPLSFSPGFIFNNRFTFKYKGMRAEITSKYVGEQYLTNYGVKKMTCWNSWTQTDATKTSETLMLGAFFTTDVDLSYTFSIPKAKWLKDITAGVALYNIFNSKYDNNGWAAPQFRQNADGSVYAVNTWGLRDSEAVGFAPSALFNVLGYVSINF